MLLNLIFWSILVITIAPNQYKEKAAVIGVDLIIRTYCLLSSSSIQDKKYKNLTMPSRPTRNNRFLVSSFVCGRSAHGQR